MGSWADGLITNSKPEKELKEVVNAFQRGGGKGKQMHLKVQVSYNETHEKALKGAFDQWRTNMFKNTVQTELSTPEKFDAASEFIKPEDIHKKVRISSKIDDHVWWLEKDIKQGFKNVYVHNVNTNQRKYIEDFGQHVIPALTES